MESEWELTYVHMSLNLEHGSASSRCALTHTRPCADTCFSLPELLCWAPARLPSSPATFLCPCPHLPAPHFSICLLPSPEIPLSALLPDPISCHSSPTFAFSRAQVANTGPRAESGPPPCFIRPCTLFLPGGSAELSLNQYGVVTCIQS